MLSISIEQFEAAAIDGAGQVRIAWSIVLPAIMPQVLLVLLFRTMDTYRLFDTVLSHWGVSYRPVHLADTGAVRQALAERPVRAVWVETPTNPLLSVVDIAAAAQACREAGALLVVDNTFATPILDRPLEVGADLVMESLTKMIGGHSDVTLGSVSGTVDLLNQITAAVSIWGLAANPFDCWLAARGLATLTLRMQAASTNAAAT